jgi:ribosomal protein S27AE
MAISEKLALVREPPTQALGSCSRALSSAGFKKIIIDETAMIASAVRRSAGQWTKDRIIVRVSPCDGGSQLAIQADAVAQSLVSLASKPYERMIEKFLSFVPNAQVLLGSAPTSSVVSPVVNRSMPAQPHGGSVCINGHSSEVSNQFCPICGVSKGRYCEAGHSMQEDHQFCPQCGRAAV